MKNKRAIKTDTLIYVTYQLYLETLRLNNMLENKVVKYLVKNNIEAKDILSDKILFKYDSDKKKYVSRLPPPVKIIKGPKIIYFD